MNQVIDDMKFEASVNCWKNTIDNLFHFDANMTLEFPNIWAISIKILSWTLICSQVQTKNVTWKKDHLLYTSRNFFSVQVSVFWRCAYFYILELSYYR